jgi:hypothetical protein
VWRGFSVNCAKELADALGAELQMVDTTYGNAIAGLQANQFDLIFALDGTVKRARRWISCRSRSSCTAPRSWPAPAPTSRPGRRSTTRR